MIRGNIKPGGLAIHQEHVLLGRLVFPTHFARALEISLAGFRTNEPPAFRIALQKRNLQPRCASIPLLKSPLNRGNSCLTLSFARICGVLLTPKWPYRKRQEDTQSDLKHYSQAD